MKKVLFSFLIVLCLMLAFTTLASSGTLSQGGYDDGGGGYCPPGGGCDGGDDDDDDDGDGDPIDPPDNGQSNPECCTGGQSCFCSSFGCCSGLICCGGICTSSCVSCDDGRCDPSESCLSCPEDCNCCPVENDCYSGSDCCSGYCCQGECSSEECGGECFSDGETCSYGSDCCGGYCCDGQCSSSSCCEENGLTCSSDDECCSGACCDGTCQEECDSVCSVSGESCESQGCCAGLHCCANNVCQEYCCTPKNSACPSEYPCCPGYICCHGKCTKGVSAACSEDDDCCTDYCCEGVCSATPCCQKTGESCEDGCCDGLSCCDGACKSSCCRESGEDCLAGNDCCSGYCCNGFCQSTDCGGSCSLGETSSCGSHGVCSGVNQECQNGEWPGCAYGQIPGYEQSEKSCDDGLDNDCDGLVDCEGPDPDCAVSHASLGCYGGYGDLDVYWFDSCGMAQDKKEDCTDGNPCTFDSCSEGKCFHEEKTECFDGDSCCPQGCSSSEDSDCKICSSPEDCGDYNECTEDTCEQGTCRNTWFECGEEDGCCGPSCDHTTDPDCQEVIENTPSVVLIHSPEINSEFKTEKLGELIDLKFAVLDSEDEYLKCFYKVDNDNNWHEITEVVIHNNTNLSVSVLVISTQPSEKEKHEITMRCDDGSEQMSEPVVREFYLKRPIGSQAPGPGEENKSYPSSEEPAPGSSGNSFEDNIVFLVLGGLVFLLFALVVIAVIVKKRKTS